MAQLQTAVCRLATGPFPGVSIGNLVLHQFNNAACMRFSEETGNSQITNFSLSLDTRKEN